MFDEILNRIQLHSLCINWVGLDLRTEDSSLVFLAQVRNPEIINCTRVRKWKHTARLLSCFLKVHDVEVIPQRCLARDSKANHIFLAGSFLPMPGPGVRARAAIFKPRDGNTICCQT